MKTIPLTQGMFAIVDDCDFEMLSKHKWSFKKDPSSGKSIGYAVRSVRLAGGKCIKLYMHRVILGLEKGKECDHADGIGLHNWRSNLRECTRTQNMQNRSIHRNNKFGVKGIEISPNGDKYVAKIIVNRRKIHLGTFLTVDAAKVSRNDAEIKYFGAFHRQIG